MKKLFLLIGIVMILGAKSVAQTDITDLLQAGKNDANTLAHPYLKPFGEMLGTGLNSGWYSSAKPHALFGFELTFTGTYVMMPSSAKTFDISALSLEKFELKPGSSSISPTVSGDMENLPTLRLKNDISDPLEFEMTNGSRMKYLPEPMISAGIGLPFGFELKGRLMPKLKIGDAGKLGLWGVGVQKDLKDYIPGVKHVPVLNVSVLAAYTKFTSELDVESDYGNGTLELSSNAFTSRLIIGANLPVVAFYTGLGYGNSDSDFNLLGTYVGQRVPIPMKDPISLAYSTSGFDMNVGMRIRFGVIAFHADYTIGNYSAVTAGLGVNFR